MKQVVVGRVLWNYLEVSGKGDPVVILHGWGRSGAEWGRVARAVNKATGRSAIVPDLPGFGGTTLKAVTDIYDYTQLLVEFLDYLKIDRFAVIGHSLGGRMGVVLASQYPARTTELVLVAPAAVKPVTPRRVIMKILRLALGWIPGTLRRRLINPFMDSDYKNDPQLRELYRAVVQLDLKSALPNIMTKTLIIWGEHDPILPLKLLPIYRDNLPQGCVRVVWDAAHDPHLSHSEATEDLIIEGLT